MINILTALDDGGAMVGVVKGCVFVTPYNDIYPVKISNKLVCDCVASTQGNG